MGLIVIGMMNMMKKILMKEMKVNMMMILSMNQASTVMMKIWIIMKLLKLEYLDEASPSLEETRRVA